MQLCIVIVTFVMTNDAAEWWEGGAGGNVAFAPTSTLDTCCAASYAMCRGQGLCWGASQVHALLRLSS